MCTSITQKNITMSMFIHNSSIKLNGNKVSLLLNACTAIIKVNEDDGGGRRSERRFTMIVVSLVGVCCMLQL